jgi:L-malate glycosyltransferase
LKVLVFAHKLVLSGTTVNAIELAAALRDMHGFDVVLFATPGPLQDLASKQQLRYIAAPEARMYPSLARIRALRNAVRIEHPDLLHVWDWPQCMDAYYGVHLPMRVPMIVTDMCMSLTRLLPMGIPTTFGIPKLVDSARAVGRRSIELLVPPVDVHQNVVTAVDPKPFEQLCGIVGPGITLVTVSRLDYGMKSDSLFRTIDAVQTLGASLPLRFIMVGDGSATAELAARAARANSLLGRRAVVLMEALVDPRPAYAAADIVVGMGGSALRGMAFGKPVIIVGEQGFSAPLRPDTAEWFYYHGIYGRAHDKLTNLDLAANIRCLAEAPDTWKALGDFSRQFVLQHFSLEAAAARFARFCHQSVACRSPLYLAAIDGLRTGAVYLGERRFLQSF